MRKKVDWKEIEDPYLRYKAYLKSDEWKELQKFVIERYNGHCAFCGRDDEPLSIHHNSYDFVGDEMNHLDTVVPLCKVCHLAGHRVRRNWSRFKRPK